MATFKATATNPWTAAKGRLDTLFLSEPDLVDAGVKDIATCMNVIEETFLTLHAQDQPSGTCVNINQQFSAAPAFLGGRFNRSGVRWSGVSEHNTSLGFPPGLHMYLLNDGATAEPLAIMSGNLLAAFTTGGMAGVGVRYLATLAAKTVAVVGNGPIAKTTLCAIMDARPTVSAVRILDDGTGRSHSFAQWARDNFEQLSDVTVTENLATACKGADIISFCTRSALPAVAPEWIPAGSLVTVWGNKHLTSLPGAQFLDDTGRDLSAIVANEAPRRTSSEETFVLTITPHPAAEVAWASHLYDQAISRSIGSVLNLWESPELD